MKIELITWFDAANDAEDGWKAVDDIIDEDTVVQSVGWVVKETERYITVAMDLCADGDTHGRGRIPKGMVTARRVLLDNDT